MGFVVKGDMNEALKQYKKATKKDMVEVVNRAAMNVAFRAAQFTPKADRQKIEALMRQQVATEVFTKTGRKKKTPKAIYAGTTAAKLIYIWRLKRQGKPIPSPLDDYVTKFVNRTLGSIAFIRAGWLPAIRKLKALVKDAGSLGDIGRSRAGKGYARPAKDDVHPFAEVINNSVNESNPTSANALIQYGLPALNQAMDFVAKDMKQHAEKKMSERGREFSAR